MYQAEYYQSLNSQGFICLQLILKSQGWEWLTVTLFPIEFAGYKNIVVRYLRTELELTFRLLKTNLYS